MSLLPGTEQALNRHLRSWANYFAFGYPTPIFRQMNWYLLRRLSYNSRRRNQRPTSCWRASTLMSFSPLGLLSLRELSPQWQPGACPRRLFPESRRQEIRTSGSIRGRAAVLHRESTLLKLRKSSPAIDLKPDLFAGYYAAERGEPPENRPRGARLIAGRQFTPCFQE